MPDERKKKEVSRTELLDVIIAQHKAMDWLLAELSKRDKTFLPTETPIWPVVKRVVAILSIEGRKWQREGKW
jgi:hypothetical protein